MSGTINVKFMSVAGRSSIMRGRALTSSDFIRWHSSTSRLVPSMLMVTDSFSFSSNLTVAAEWKTTLTLLHSKF